MREETFEIRICSNCGLRYPSLIGRAHGTRCPVCMGETRVALTRKLTTESNLLPAPTPSPRNASQATGKWGKFSVLLDNIRSAWNAGSILRSAEGFGFAHAFLCGITPTPENDAVRKTSLGAEDAVPWSYHKDAVKLVKGLKAKGWKVYGLEDSATSTPLQQISNPKTDSVLIVGNEVTGVDPDLLDLCERVFHIPMRGEKKSFNAAVAFGIAAHTLTAPH